MPGPSLALLTDLYQLTMAYGYWRLGRAEEEAVFHLFFRRPPFRGGYAIAAGLQHALDYLRALRFDASDLEYLGTLTGNDGAQLFSAEFLEYLGGLRFTCDVDGVPEGTAMFAHEPLLRVRGPILQGQLVETPLLNLLNFSTLIATKAARVCSAAGGESVLEFGLRRAQGIDGALSAARAAYIGGCSATSNVLAGKLYGIPVRGTHAHSWVMSFDDEREAFAAYAEALPNNCVFLVDTYDTLEGVRHAIAVGEQLRARGHALAGVRLDSGDLAALSQAARRLLDAAGFPDAAIVASNDLDEQAITRLRAAGAKISVWGVGTRLITGHDQPALGGVYKLAAVRGDASMPWQYRIKLSEEPIKVSNPGVQQVRRHRGADGGFIGDVIHDTELGLGAAAHRVDAPDQRFVLEGEGEALLVPLLRAGVPVYTPPPLVETRARTLAQLECLPPGVRKLQDAEVYPVGLDERLQTLKDGLIAAARARTKA
ncbi:MAG: nicotinate phosphoribosyltransferase [Nannocystis sp.]|nr:nicotinate phosphoribosyltransferase [Nannocystis sp.]MBA3550483.1 nicotinate phosphoribosyltransferase [Nannocystis sp.]